MKFAKIFIDLILSKKFNLIDSFGFGNKKISF